MYVCAGGRVCVCEPPAQRKEKKTLQTVFSAIYNDIMDNMKTDINRC